MQRQDGPQRAAPSDLSKIKTQSNRSADVAAGPTNSQIGTAYERIVDKLHGLDLRVGAGYRSSVAQCPSHDDRQPSLGIYDKDGRAKIVCFAGCDDELDILPALEMTVADLYDVRGYSAPGEFSPPDPEQEARRIARQSMTPSQKALYNLLQLPDLGERLCMGIARMRPELYIWEREQLADEVGVNLHPKYLPFIDWLTEEFSSPASERWAA